MCGRGVWCQGVFREFEQHSVIHCWAWVCRAMVKRLAAGEVMYSGLEGCSSMANGDADQFHRAPVAAENAASLLL